MRCTPSTSRPGACTACRRTRPRRATRASWQWSCTRGTPGRSRFRSRRSNPPGGRNDALTQTGARLLVVDPIMAFLDPRILAGNDQSVRQALYPLARIAETHAWAVLLVRHLNKRGGSRSLYRGGGSIAFLGACRSGWLIARDPQAPSQCVLAQVKNNLAPPQS